MESCTFGNPVDWDRFIREYEPVYYNTSQSKLIRRKSSLFVEKEIEKILATGLRAEDIPLVIAWKIGNINHKESTNRIVFKNNCNQTLEFKTQYNIIKAKPLVDYIANNLSYLKNLAESDPYKSFAKLCENKVDYFGTTYLLTLLYFLSQGTMPIYDKFAHIALLALKDEVKPHEPIYGYKPIEQARDNISRVKAWKTYMDYRNLLIDLAGENRYRDKSIDRALWVYGHAFKNIR